MMANYKSRHTGPQIDEAIDAATKRNLLINWYFPRPINQRSVSGTISAAGYFIDMWKLVSGTVTITSNGLALNGTIAQVLEYAAGTNVYASVKTYAGTAAAAYNNTTKTVTVTSSGGTVESVKLENGSASTLANDPPPDYGAELAKCQRYQFKNTNGASQFIRAAQLSANAIYFDIPTPVTMRASPTIASYDTMEVRAFAGAAQTGFTFSAAANNNGVRLTASKSGHGLTDASLNAVSVLLDANL